MRSPPEELHLASWVATFSLWLQISLLSLFLVLMGWNFKISYIWPSTINGQFPWPVYSPKLWHQHIKISAYIVACDGSSGESWEVTQKSDNTWSQMRLLLGGTPHLYCWLVNCRDPVSCYLVSVDIYSCWDSWPHPGVCVGSCYHSYNANTGVTGRRQEWKRFKIQSSIIKLSPSWSSTALLWHCL